MKLKFLFLSVVLVLLVAGCAPAVTSLTSQVVTLPEPLPALIGTGVLIVVGLLLRGRVPDQFVIGVAAAITTALVEILNLALGLVPLEWEAVVNSALQLLVVLLGTVEVLKFFFLRRFKEARLI